MKKQKLTLLKNIFSPSNVGIYIVISSIIGGMFFYQAKMAALRDSISVYGVAYKDVEANKSTWNITLEKQTQDKQTSYEQVLQDYETVTEYLTSQNIKNSEISKPAVQVFPVYKKIEHYTTDEIVGYKAEARFTIRSNNVDTIANAKHSITPFAIQNNLEFFRNDVEYLYTELEGDKIEMIQKAVENARDRAEALGKVTNTSIGRATNASQGIFQLNPRGDYTVSDYGNFDTSSINKTIKATVTVDFEVK